MSLYLRILSYLKPYALVLVAAMLASVLFATFDAFSFVALIPFLRTLFSEAPIQLGADNELLESLLRNTVGLFVSPDSDPEEALLGVMLFILAVFTLKNIFSFLYTYLTTWIEQSVTRDLREDVYGHLLDLDLAFFGRTKMGQILSRLTHDVEQLRALVTQQLSRAVTSLFQVLATLAFMVTISWVLTGVAVIVLPAMFLIWVKLVGRVKRGDRRVLDMAGEVNAHIQETLSGVRLVKTSTAEEKERGRFKSLVNAYRSFVIRTEALRALAGPASEMLGAVATVIILWYGSRLVLVDGALTAEAFIGFIALSTKLYSPVKQLSRLPTQVQPGLVAGERLFEFLDAPVEIRDRAGAVPFEGFDDAIAFEDVSFEYEPGEPVLRDVSVRVPRGAVVALVGPSGAGKTTMVDLVGRFYEPTSGRIAIDGTDIREFTIGSLRSHLGIVSQETVLFHDTVRANIAYGLGDVADGAVREAAKAAYAHDFIDVLPDGYDTVVGERGTRLSGGQRQRIAIARAILRDPPILILDEATSALDAEAERLIQRALEHLLEGRTVFVIAHRLSTVRMADEILVLDEGRIVERGRHDDLLARDGLYRRLHDFQETDSVLAAKPGDPLP